MLPTATLTVNGTEGGESANIQVDFNGFVEIVNYGQYSTNISLASALAAMFVRDYHSFGLYAKAAVNPAQPNVITFQLANGSAFAPLNVVGPTTTFTLAGLGFGSSSTTTADIGYATLTIQNVNQSGPPYSYKVNYGEGSTGASIAQDLASVAASNSLNGAPVAVTSEGPNLYLQVKQPSGSYDYSYNLSFLTNVSFGTSTPAGGYLTNNSDAAPVTVYSYSVTNSQGQSGYQPNGNIQNISDWVMGNWTYGYDSLNRLTSGLASGGPYNGGSTCWTYDSFGNRLAQSVSTVPCGSNPPSTFAAQYASTNRIAAVTTPANSVVTYDAAGNVTNDGVNTLCLRR